MVVLPAKLTAENGAKALLLGEFAEKVLVLCDSCGGDGYFDEESGDVCAYCGGAGDYAVRVPVSWTTIKAIYAKIVEHFAEEQKPRS
jgi:hypothetical protein